MTCSETADDIDDVCVEVTVDSRPRTASVKIRECLGEKKKYCEWGHPDFHRKHAWPFNPSELTATRFDYIS